MKQFEMDMKKGVNVEDWLRVHPEAIYGDAPFGFYHVYRGAYRVYGEDGTVIECLVEGFDDVWEEF